MERTARSPLRSCADIRETTDSNGKAGVARRCRHVAPPDRLASAQQHDDGAAAAGVTSGLAIGEDVVPLR